VSYTGDIAVSALIVAGSAFVFTRMRTRMAL
jgi:hypothetical protein